MAIHNSDVKLFESHRLTDELSGMSSAAHDSFVAMQRGLGSVDVSEVRGSITELKSELEEGNQQLHDLQHTQQVFDATDTSQ